MCILFLVCLGLILVKKFIHDPKYQKENKQTSLPKSASSLLVHLCPWRHAVHSHEENLARLDDPEEHLQVVEDVSEDLFLGDAEVDVLIVGVGTLVNDPIHVQVEIVEFWNLKRKKQTKIMQ